MLKRGSVVQCILASLNIKTAFDEARLRHVAQIIDSHNTHGWSLPPACERCRGYKGKPYFECVESIFVFNRCLRQGSVETPRFGKKEWKLDNFLDHVARGDRISSRCCETY